MGTDAVEFIVKQNWQEDMTMDAADEVRFKDGQRVFRIYRGQANYLSFSPGVLESGRFTLMDNGAKMVLYKLGNDYEVDTFPEDWYGSVDEAIAARMVYIQKLHDQNILKLNALIHSFA